MKINLEKWTQDRIETETAIRALKATMRESYHMVSHAEQSQLEGLKVRATYLYRVRAHFRGRQHTHKMVEYVSHLGSMVREESLVTYEQEHEMVSGWMDDYALSEAVEATA